MQQHRLKTYYQNVALIRNERGHISAHEGVYMGIHTVLCMVCPCPVCEGCDRAQMVSYDMRSAATAYP